MLRLYLRYKKSVLLISHDNPPVCPATHAIRIIFVSENFIPHTKALLHNKNILRLSLKSNGVGESGLVAMCSALTRNKTLKNISLFGNAFSHVACENFHALHLETPAVSLEHSWSPVELDICAYAVDGIFLVAEKEEIFA